VVVILLKLVRVCVCVCVLLATLLGEFEREISRLFEKAHVSALISTQK
jgi:hypothetical protein